MAGKITSGMRDGYRRLLVKAMEESDSYRLSGEIVHMLRFIQHMDLMPGYMEFLGYDPRMDKGNEPEGAA